MLLYAGAGAVPLPWEVHADDNSKIFYHNTESGAVQWDHPITGALPEPWEARLDGDSGRILTH